MSAVRLTIGITTRDRPAALELCLRSMSVVAHLSPEVVVFDDASRRGCRSVAGWDVGVPVRVVRDIRAGLHRRPKCWCARLGRSFADGR
jgi:hypothetical protein